MNKFDLSGLGGLVLATIFVLMTASRPVAPHVNVTTQDATAVGTFTAADLVIAYYKSPAFTEKLRALKAEHAEAKKRGDEEKVRELEKTGEGLQERAHRQLAGEAPITEILDALRPSFPEVAKAAGVGAIVDDFVWRSPAFKTVDVTDKLVARLAAAESRR